jgi:hypothetical protein
VEAAAARGIRWRLLEAALLRSVVLSRSLVLLVEQNQRTELCGSELNRTR